MELRSAGLYEWWDYTGEGDPNNIMDPNNWRWCNYASYPHSGNATLDPDLTGFGHPAASDFSTTVAAGDTMNQKWMIDGSTTAGGAQTINIPATSDVFFGNSGGEIDGGVTININGGTMTINGGLTPTVIGPTHWP